MREILLVTTLSHSAGSFLGTVLDLPDTVLDFGIVVCTGVDVDIVGEAYTGQCAEVYLLDSAPLGEWIEVLVDLWSVELGLLVRSG